jgi:hypothetical protein
VADVGRAGKGLFKWVRFEVKVRPNLSGWRLNVGGSRCIAVFGRSGGHDDGGDGDDDNTT